MIEVSDTGNKGITNRAREGPLTNGVNKMNVKELIELLEEVEDKSLEVRCVAPLDDDTYNLWAYDIEVTDRNSNGYEHHGEVRILTTE
tara:strand:- start:585 stop:848 length:264 start_codon:yes stop_codon:yes gene_type:complete